LVISGNRRLQIALNLTNITHIPVIIKEIKDSEVDEYLIIQYNQQRVKNIVQVAREYELIRIQHGMKQGIKDKDAIELSKTSKTKWCNPVPSEVSPIYIPGRFLTASRPSNI
jgi:ParB-like chromosome segregation protein Spo0J